MPITATYTVKCDICFGELDGEYATRDEALQARRELGWEGGYGETVCGQPCGTTGPSEAVAS